MMNSKIFLEHGKCCPICNQKLSLYATVSNIGTFKCTNNFIPNKKNKFNFYPLKDNTFNLDLQVNKTDNFVLKGNDNSFSLMLSSENLFNLLINKKLNFFYLCDLSSICKSDYDGGTPNNYEIDMFNLCYYSLSNTLLFDYKNNNLQIIQTEGEQSTQIEIFCLGKTKDKYTLYYDYNSKKTTFYFNNEDKISKTFTKDFPLLDYYPDFKNQDKLINKFKSWIWLS